MAKAFDVTPVVLETIEVITAIDFLYAVMQLENELGLFPVEGSDGVMAVGFDPGVPKSPKVQMTLQAW